MLYGQKQIFHTKYVKGVYMWYGQVVCIFHLYRGMSYDMEQVHNESIDMNFLVKGYINIAPTGHNLSFIELQNLPYSVLIGLIFPGILS